MGTKTITIHEGESLKIDSGSFGTCVKGPAIVVVVEAASIIDDNQNCSNPELTT